MTHTSASTELAVPIWERAAITAGTVVQSWTEVSVSTWFGAIAILVVGGFAFYVFLVVRGFLNCFVVLTNGAARNLGTIFEQRDGSQEVDTLRNTALEYIMSAERVAFCVMWSKYTEEYLLVTGVAWTCTVTTPERRTYFPLILITLLMVFVVQHWLQLKSAAAQMHVRQTLVALGGVHTQAHTDVDYWSNAWWRSTASQGGAALLLTAGVAIGSTPLAAVATVGGLGSVFGSLVASNNERRASHAMVKAVDAGRFIASELSALQSTMLAAQNAKGPVRMLAHHVTSWRVSSKRVLHQIGREATSQPDTTTLRTPAQQEHTSGQTVSTTSPLLGRRRGPRKLAYVRNE